MVHKVLSSVFHVLILSLLGASFFEEIHRGYCDGQLCVLWEHEGWRRETEGTKESKEAPCQDELQVILSFSLLISQLLSPTLPLRPLMDTEDKIVPGLFLWVTRRWEPHVMCILAIHKVALMSLIYDHFLWLGSKTTNRSIELSPVKSSPPNCCHAIAKSSLVYRTYVKVCMSHVYFSFSKLLIF